MTATPLAALAVRADLTNFGKQIGETFDRVYAFLRAHESPKIVGHNVILYDGLLKPGSRVEMGVQIDPAFRGAGEIIYTSTPAGKVARTVHVGAYVGLPQAHAAIGAWCKERGHPLAGRSWEIYGDWHDDPAKLETEVLQLLA